MPFDNYDYVCDVWYPDLFYSSPHLKYFLKFLVMPPIVYVQDTASLFVRNDTSNYHINPKFLSLCSKIISTDDPGSTSLSDFSGNYPEKFLEEDTCISA